MFHSASNISITGGTFSVFNDNSVHHHHILRESSDLLYREIATAAFHNSNERFDAPKCHPKTRLAVLSEIMKWIKWEGDLDSFIMWLYGPAGAGKSAIAQTIAEMCEEEMILLASFFFSRTDPSRNNVRPLIATIAYQITLNIPDVRDAILGTVERDPLIFSKSLTIQFKSLIVEPLRQLVEAGFFNEPNSRRLVIIDGLDECFDPKVQRNILEVLVKAQRQHRLPLIFLFASRPEQHISLAFNTTLLPIATTRIALDESYLPGDDIKLFLIDKFEEIKSTHRLRRYIPPQWPPPNVLQQLVEKASGQFIYASTVINYVSSTRSKPHNQLDIILGIRPPQRDLPFAELDALYMHILSGVEDIDFILEILSVILFSSNRFPWPWSSPLIEEFLSWQPGDVEMYLGDMSSLVNVGPDQRITIPHASLTDFLMDHTRSKEFWVNPPVQHTGLARRCLQILQRHGDVRFDLLWLCYFDTISHCENAEITRELRDDLLNFSFDRLLDFFDTFPARCSQLFPLIPPFLSGLKKLTFSEADHLSQLLQIDFDKMLGNILKKYSHYPGIALLLGALLEHKKIGYSQTHFPMPIVPLHPLLILYGTEFWGFMELYIEKEVPSHQEFFNYFAALLENPQRSKAHSFDQERYVVASKECMQLCLCLHSKFSRRVREYAYRDKALRRRKPSLWRRRVGVHGRIRKARYHFKARQLKSLKAQDYLDQSVLAENEYARSLSYRWALDLLPSFLEKSAASLELAEVLRGYTFTTMGQKFPRRMRLAKEAVLKYLLRIDAGPGVDEQ